MACSPRGKTLSADIVGNVTGERKSGSAGSRKSQVALNHANVIHHRRKIVLVLWVKLRYVECISVHSTRGVLMRRLASGERERHLRAKDVRNFRPRAVLGQPRRPLGAGPVRPRSKA